MKYHYQYVSSRSVRIELIAEDKRESARLAALENSAAHEQELKQLYSAALLPYAAGSAITKINFMDFPRVALVSFEKVAPGETSFA